MTIRLVGALLCSAALVVAAQTDLAQAQSNAVVTGRVTNASGQPELKKPRNGSGATNSRATTVKSSKSNTSDRAFGAGGKGITFPNRR